MKREEYIKKILINIPEKPGVYLMKNQLSEIIYIGKAISLKKRVRQYFGSKVKDPKVMAMVNNVDDIEYIITSNEMEALLLENNLIKKNKPFYNILLRDDKTFPYIKVTREAFPRIIKTRNKLDKEGEYFGPYTDVTLMNNYLRDINEYYKIRDCSRNIEKSLENKERPCLNFYIKLCSAPCAGNISKQDYNKDVACAVDFLKGNQSNIRQIYQIKMKEASQKLDFEGAATYRDRIKDLDSMNKKQHISVHSFDKRQDYISYALSEDNILFTVLLYEDGNLSAKEHYDFVYQMGDINEIFSSFLLQYYTDNSNLPKEVYIDAEKINVEAIQEIISQINERKICVYSPQRGKKREIIHLAKKNSLEQLRFIELKNLKKRQYLENAHIELESLTGISPIHIIESFDISNISGTDSVGAKVVFKDGKKSPSDYRKYKVNQHGKNDDYAAITEVVGRRIKKGDFPDIILLDGGKGHVSTIKKLLIIEGVNIPVFGIFKDDKHQTQGLCDENQQYEIGKNTSLFRYLSEIQNEVHRFAITYHRNKRDKTMLQSELDGIEGIGEKRKIDLLKEFGGIDKIKNASLDELTKIPSINKKNALNIIEFFSTKERS